MPKLKKTKRPEFKVNDRGVWEKIKDARLRLIAPYVEKTADLISATTGKYHTEISFMTKAGRMTTLVLSRSGARDINGLREVLVDQGYKWPPAKSAKEKLLITYLEEHEPGKEVYWVAKTGWHEETTFVFEDGAIGPKANSVKYRPLGVSGPKSAVAGTLPTWQRAINSILSHSNSGLLALGTAFAAPLLQDLDIEGGGFNLFGRSSRGKTTICVAARSLYCGASRDEADTWDTSPTALDELRCENADMLLYLDDMARAGKDDRERIDKITDTFFRLTTGRSRGRSKHYKVDPNFPKSRGAILSSSVHSVWEISAATGTHQMSGEEVRVIDVPALASDDLGVFETLPRGFSSTEKAVKALEATCAKNYGVAGREYIRRLIADRESAIRFAKDRVDGFVRKLGIPADGWESRYIKRFAASYAGLRLAAKLRVIELPKGTAYSAVSACYTRAKRAVPSFQQSLSDAIDALKKSLSTRRDLLDLSRPSRTATEAKYADCSGVVVKRAADGFVFAIKLEKLAALSRSNLPAREILRELKARKLVVLILGGKSSIPTKIPGLSSQKRRLICIKPTILGAA